LAIYYKISSASVTNQHIPQTRERAILDEFSRFFEVLIDQHFRGLSRQQTAVIVKNIREKNIKRNEFTENGIVAKEREHKVH
jgi:hypothetical protein